MQKIVPFLWFDDQVEEAVTLYTSLFKNSKIGSMTHLGNDVPGPRDKVIMATFQLAGQEFMALNGGPEYSFTPAISFFVSCQTEDELDGLWKRLSEGGGVLMELGQYPFSEKFGWLVDKFGVSWQLTLARLPQKITPFFMFVGAQHGKAEKAMDYYTSLFNNSSVSQVERYGEGEGEPEGTIKHARFILHGQEFMAMDSNLNHQFTFTPAISFFVHCEDQKEVDFLWDKLSEGGEPGQCGWLVDQFGVSWQIVPNALGEMMSDPDPEKASRVTQAMLKMTKLDVQQLERAYRQA